jgi:ribosomal protein S12 methylthiotransferase accessory factor
MTRATPVHIFAGPSLHGTPYDDEAPDDFGGTVVWLPPARRGDIESLISQYESPGVIGLADGTFHTYPSVAHVELREAIATGWRVYGLCSMGALRAAEMRHQGLIPFGRVAAAFCGDPDLPDDEVALVHSTEAPFHPFSEPLVHIRAYLQHMHELALLDATQHDEMVAVVRERWYAERTFKLIRQELQRVASPSALAELFSRLENFAPYRLKQQDLMQFLASKPWLETVAIADDAAALSARVVSQGAALAEPKSAFAPAFKLSSSLRSRSAEESLRLAVPLALERGVSRVTDTTWLDRLGLPVYASIRPDAPKNSLNVHAGKGFAHAEAKIGAYMEAIEFSFAESGRSCVEPHLATPLEILASFDGTVDFPVFCPSQRFSREVQADDLLGVVEGDEVLSLNHKVLVPAELVFYPYSGPGVRVYGSTMNGLASGNNIEEATVHALAEVMERDVDSFLRLGAPSYLVDPLSLPPRLRAMVDRFTDAGMEFYLRYAPNEFGLPHLSGFVIEEGDFPAAMATGMGFHCNSDIAAVRAISEAAQSRLTTIHGGRDDLVDLQLKFHNYGPEKSREVRAHMRRSVSDSRNLIAFQDIPDAKASTIEAARAALVEGLGRAGLRHVVRVVLTGASCPFQVVRVIVPGAEHHNADNLRVGPRILQYALEKAARADATQHLT